MLHCIAQVEKLKEADASVLGVFKGDSSPELTAFLAVADAQRDSFSFAYTSDAALAGGTFHILLIWQPL